MLDLLCCPQCHRAPLDFQPESVQCPGCGCSYPKHCGIPDFRQVRPDQCGYSSVEKDREAASRIWEYSRDHTYRETVEMWVDSFAVPATRDMHVQFRLDNPIKAASLRQKLAGVPRGIGLDIGCGSGGGTLGLVELCSRVVSVDVQLAELVCARKMMEEMGLADRCLFLAASAEALPLPDNSVTAACALDVFEHVFDQGRFVREGHRVLRAGGTFFFQTPSRYHWMETHYMLPGLGYLPRFLQKLYVRLARQDCDYPVFLVGLGRLRRLLRETLPRPDWRLEALPWISEQPRQVGWKGRLLRSLPGWRLVASLINRIARHFTAFEVYVGKGGA